MTTERLKSHADWLQDRADNPSTVMPGSTEPRSIVDSKRLGEIAKDIREFAEDVDDAEKLEMCPPPNDVVLDGPWLGDVMAWGGAWWMWRDRWVFMRKVGKDEVDYDELIRKWWARI